MIGVVVDLAQGRACVGDLVVAVAPAPKESLGAVIVGSMVLRPLRFGERVRLVDYCAGSPPAALAATVLATVADGAAAGPEVEAIALHLAGARLGSPADTPGFAASASLVVHAYGWSPQQLAEADADLVDKLTAELSATGSGDDGWASFTFGTDTLTAAQVRDELALDLLRRGTARPAQAQHPQRPRRDLVRDANVGDARVSATSTSDFDAFKADAAAPADTAVVSTVSCQAVTPYAVEHESTVGTTMFTHSTAASAGMPRWAGDNVGKTVLADWPGTADTVFPATAVTARRQSAQQDQHTDHHPVAHDRAAEPYPVGTPLALSYTDFRVTEGTALGEDLAGHLATLLDEEADLRGVRR